MKKIRKNEEIKEKVMPAIMGFCLLIYGIYSIKNKVVVGRGMIYFEGYYAIIGGICLASAGFGIFSNNIIKIFTHYFPSKNSDRLKWLESVNLICIFIGFGSLPILLYVSRTGLFAVVLSFIMLCIAAFLVYHSKKSS